MRSTPRLLWRVLALLLALTLVAAACGDDDDSADEGAGDDGTEATDDGGEASGDDGEEATDDGGEAMGVESLDLSGISVAVGSKDFTEQLVLGEILVQALEAAGADVENRVNLGGTVVNRDALLAGEIDTYWEYNGTGWTVHLGQEEPSFDSEQLTEDVREMDLAENGIQWLGRSPFNNTYGFATGPDLTAENGGPFSFESMAEYLEANPDASVCMESEFPNRPDGLVLWEDHTGYDIPDSQQEILETGIIYNETANGNCDFGEIFTTDGRIPALDLTIVEDPGVMIIYNVSMNLRDEVYQEAPEAFDQLADMLLEPLTQETMADLNGRVAVEGEDAADVAEEFLVSNGLVSG